VSDGQPELAGRRHEQVLLQLCRLLLLLLLAGDVQEAGALLRRQGNRRRITAAQ